MRRGFTLIEMILVIAIMSIIGGSSAISVRYYKVLKNKIDAQYYCTAVVSFINNSKMYCRENSCSAIIVFDIEKNEMILKNGTAMVSKLAFSNKITLDRVIGGEGSANINIDRKGNSSDAGSIYLTDNNDRPHKITMIPETGYVSVVE